MSLNKMVMVHNGCCAVIDVQSLHKDLSWHMGKKASSGTFASNENKESTQGQAVVL